MSEELLPLVCEELPLDELIPKAFRVAGPAIPSCVNPFFLFYLFTAVTVWLP